MKTMNLQVRYRSLLIVLFCGFLFAGLSTAWAKEVQDEDITSHLEVQYRLDNSVPSDKIDVVTSEGVVTLSGAVNTILAKDRASAIAQVTVGVRAVVNQIEVVPPVRPDESIKKDVEQALLDDPATDSYEIDVYVNDGAVTLTGTVDSWQETQLSEKVAKGVKGVVGINNQINIKYKTERSDFEIEQEIKQRLAYDIRVDDALIDVTVEEEKVTLSGIVGSVQEKNQAINDSWVAGVNSVNADGLEIKWWARDEMRRKESYTSKNDSEVKQAIKDAFLYDPRVFSFNIDVDVNYGTATLSGIVDNLAAKNAAEQDAKNTIGVNRVINNIKVRPAVIPSNDDLRSSVAKALLNDPYIERFKLDVSAYGGTVYLSGEVNTSWEKKRAENIAEGVKGVLYVDNNVEYEYSWTWKPDWEIQANIKDELFWSPFVDEDQVTVSVDNGVATLTGTVSTYGERQSAEENAFEGGAKDVKNKLTVTYEDYGPYYYGPYSPYYGFYPYYPY